MSDHVISITMPVYLALRAASERTGLSMRRIVEDAIMSYGDIARIPVTSENLRTKVSRGAQPTTRSRVAARYCELTGCMPWAAAHEFGITIQAVRQGIASCAMTPSRISTS